MIIEKKVLTFTYFMLQYNTEIQWRNVAIKSNVDKSAGTEKIYERFKRIIPYWYCTCN